MLSDTNHCVSIRGPCMAQCHGFGKGLVVLAYSGTMPANMLPVNLQLLQDPGFPCV